MFKPWVGENYTAGFKGKKVLILGEAHYCDTTADCDDCYPGQKNKCNSFTIDFIDGQLSGVHKRFSFFSKLTRLFIGDDSDNEAVKQFWDSVAFYNYIQRTVGEKARVRPSAEMWNEAILPFKEVMDELDPNFLLILGNRNFFIMFIISTSLSTNQE